MTFQLETAAHPEKPAPRRDRSRLARRGPRQGDASCSTTHNRVHQVRLHIVEFRGFEKFIQGRPYWEVPVMVQRLCGICPVSHHLAASKALRRDRRRDAAHADGREDPPADALRADPAVARAALLPPVLARPAVRLRQRRRAPQHRRRRAGAPRDRAARRAAAQVRPGGDPHHRRQARPRHRRDPRRRQQGA